MSEDLKIIVFCILFKQTNATKNGLQNFDNKVKVDCFRVKYLNIGCEKWGGSACFWNWFNFENWAVYWQI